MVGTGAPSRWVEKAVWIVAWGSFGFTHDHRWVTAVLLACGLGISVIFTLRHGGEGGGPGEAEPRRGAPAQGWVERMRDLGLLAMFGGLFGLLLSGGIWALVLLVGGIVVATLAWCALRATSRRGEDAGGLTKGASAG